MGPPTARHCQAALSFREFVHRREVSQVGVSFFLLVACQAENRINWRESNASISLASVEDHVTRRCSYGKRGRRGQKWLPTLTHVVSMRLFAARLRKSGGA
ncbi:unnamed protein product [Scytosiphon promiscuus]